MKITIYELLGLIKDGKVPKRIKAFSKTFLYDEEYNNYYDDNGDKLFDEDLVFNLDFEIEIIEDKPISKLYINNEMQYDLNNKKIEKLNIDDIDYFTMNNKINEIIDKLNEGDK